MGGRPRSEDARRAILAATAALLRERSLSDITVEAIAALAGTGKATIYRWWPGKEVLALDAVLEEWSCGLPDHADHGNLRDDLAAIVVPWVRRLDEHAFARLVLPLVAELQRRDGAFSDLYHERFSGRRRAPARAALERAAKRGEIAESTDLEFALDLLYGPIYHRLLHMHAPLTDAFASDVVDTVVRGLAVRPLPCRWAPGTAAKAWLATRGRGCSGAGPGS
jgi:AcrR family transcriptional regulator